MYNSRAFLAGEHRPSVEWTGERVYMQPIRLLHWLPTELSRWDPVVGAMVRAIRDLGYTEDGDAYLMIDQTVADDQGMTRRPGWHIDGYWDPGLMAHSPRHLPRPSHVPRPTHRPRHGSGSVGDWSTAEFKEPEGIVLWSDVGALGAWMGEFEGPIGEGGSIPDDTSLGGGHSLLQRDGQIICGNVTMMHMTIPIEPGARRTIVRLNVPGWSP